MARESRRMGHALTAQGVGKGDPVFLMMPRIPEWYVAALGAIRIGAIPMPGTSLLGHTITARYWQDLREGDVHWTISDMGWAKAAWGCPRR